MAAKKSSATLVIFILLLALAGGWLATKNTPQAVEEATTGSAAIGGSFTLTDQQGNAFKEQQLRGKYALIFFGFTHCPDICPAGLSTITNALEILPESVASQINPVFITVDPERDTPERMAEYTANFHPDFISLTGTPEAVAEAADNYKVFYEKAGVHQDADGNYMVNHSGYVYFMGPDGNYIKHFSHNADPQKLAAMVSDVIAP